jgi:hypothetical protein
MRKCLDNIPNRVAQSCGSEVKSGDKTESKNLIMKIRLGLVIKKKIRKGLTNTKVGHDHSQWALPTRSPSQRPNSEGNDSNALKLRYEL